MLLKIVKYYFKNYVRENKFFLIFMSSLYAYVASRFFGKPPFHYLANLANLRMFLVSLAATIFSLIGIRILRRKEIVNRFPLLNIHDDYTIYLSPLNDKQLLKYTLLVLLIDSSLSSYGIVPLILFFYPFTIPLTLESIVNFLFKSFLIGFFLSFFSLFINIITTISRVESALHYRSKYWKYQFYLLNCYLYVSLANSIIMLILTILSMLGLRIDPNILRTLVLTNPIALILLFLTLILKFNPLYTYSLLPLPLYLLPVVLLSLLAVKDDVSSNRLFIAPQDKVFKIVKEAIPSFRIRSGFDFVSIRVMRELGSRIIFSVGIIVVILAVYSLKFFVKLPSIEFFMVILIFSMFFLPSYFTYTYAVMEGSRMWIYRTTPIKLSKLLLLGVISSIILDLIAFLPVIGCILIINFSFKTICEAIVFLLFLLASEVVSILFGVIEGTRGVVSYTETFSLSLGDVAESLSEGYLVISVKGFTAIKVIHLVIMITLMIVTLVAIAVIELQLRLGTLLAILAMIVDTIITLVVLVFAVKAIEKYTIR